MMDSILFYINYEKAKLFIDLFFLNQIIYRMK